MARIQVVTDSACDLSADLTAQEGVTVVPLSIRFGSEEFTDGTTLSSDEFWTRCAKSEYCPRPPLRCPAPPNRRSWRPPTSGAEGSSA